MIQLHNLGNKNRMNMVSIWIPIPKYSCSTSPTNNLVTLTVLLPRIQLILITIRCFSCPEGFHYLYPPSAGSILGLRRDEQRFFTHLPFWIKSADSLDTFAFSSFFSLHISYNFFFWLFKVWFAPSLSPNDIVATDWAPLIGLFLYFAFCVNVLSRVL